MYGDCGGTTLCDFIVQPRSLSITVTVSDADGIWSWSSPKKTKSIKVMIWSSLCKDKIKRRCCGFFWYERECDERISSLLFGLWGKYIEILI